MLHLKIKWIQALYWLSVKALKNRKWIPEKRALADFDTEVELKAKDFIYAVTDHNIKKKQLEWKDTLENELVDNTKATRKTLIERDIIPEELDKKEDLKLIEKRKGKILKNKSVKNNKIIYLKYDKYAKGVKKTNKIFWFTKKGFYKPTKRFF